MLAPYRSFLLCLKMATLTLNMTRLNFVEFVFWTLTRTTNDGTEELLVAFYHHLHSVPVNYICGKISCTSSCVGSYKMLQNFAHALKNLH